MRDHHMNHSHSLDGLWGWYLVEKGRVETICEGYFGSSQPHGRPDLEMGSHWEMPEACRWVEWSDEVASINHFQSNYIYFEQIHCSSSVVVAWMLFYHTSDVIWQKSRVGSKNWCKIKFETIEIELLWQKSELSWNLLNMASSHLLHHQMAFQKEQLLLLQLAKPWLLMG